MMPMTTVAPMMLALVLRPALTPSPLACKLRPRAIAATMDADADAKVIKETYESKMASEAAHWEAHVHQACPFFAQGV